MSKPEIILRFEGEYRWLSNFWPSPVTLDGVEYPTVENAYQAAKQWQKELRGPFIDCPPGQAKRMGQELTAKKHHRDWDNVKITVMAILITQKFRPCSVLASTLMDTYPCVLIEGNTWGDMFWGVCLQTGRGENILGQLLMARRYSLIQADREERDKR